MKNRARDVSMIASALLWTGVTLMVATRSPVQIPPRPQGPCDIYAAAGTACVAAHSTTRALVATYSGPLYQVKRMSDLKTLDIGIDAGGYANADAQDTFCANAACVINVIYDQSKNGNHLYQAPPGPQFPGPAKGAFDTQTKRSSGQDQRGSRSDWRQCGQSVYRTLQCLLKFCRHLQLDDHQHTESVGSRKTRNDSGRHKNHGRRILRACPLHFGTLCSRQCRHIDDPCEEYIGTGRRSKD